MLEEIFKVVISDKGIVAVNYGNQAMNEEAIEVVLKDESNNTIEVTIANTPKGLLPVTGGNGRKVEWTLQYTSKEKLFPIIQMYLKSSLPKIEIQLIKKTIEHKLLNTAQIVFVSEERTADITLSTETTQKGILINANLTEKDFLVMKEEIRKLLQ